MAWRRSLSASQLNPNLLAPDFDHAFPPEEMFAQSAGDVSDGDSGDDGAAAEIVTRGFGTRAHRSARPDPRGFEAVVHELDASKFWEPHAVVATSKDEVFLVDDGKSRPNCTGATATCFSRAVGYKLDAATEKATLFWEFEFPVSSGSLAVEEAEDIFNFDGGYVSRLDRADGDARYVVAFTAVVVDDDADTGHPAFIFEVDADGTALSKIRLPRVPTTHKSGSYRAEATTSVNGESFARPW